ncbi:glycoside hydrolase family 1 protein [Nakamurella leprariae]|uniref:Family 1 glycosylhydrolase n=1 Tax=Nakamurella leprariae TaxID=2803911 RepID=A0A938Y9R1_9ACTN|nr:family 1 glycosylhydrolase [Nakamurella leprariae]MBM9466547.1 family 1 glycosylhydrolase [Nakamurella leprariae]
MTPDHDAVDLTRALPPAFRFGVTGSAAQLEGGTDAGARTPSVWDLVAAVPGRTADGSTPAVAADHLTRLAEDVDLLRELHPDVWRTSVSWSRVQPGGRGPADPAGLAVYDRMVDAVLAAGVSPWLTLSHWDLPVELMEQGGWLVRATAEAFADYAELVTARLGDRVAGWFTFEAPVLHALYGYGVGIDAPGLTLFGGAFAAVHHQLLAHGWAAHRIRAVGGRVGVSNQHTSVDPASDAPLDRAAARWFAAFADRQATDALFCGRYPAAVLRTPGVEHDVVADGDLAAIAVPLDHYGVDWAGPTVVAAAPDNPSVPLTLVPHPAPHTTDSGLAVHPASLTRVLVDLHRRYPVLPPVVVSAGGAFSDRPAAAGAPTDAAGWVPDDDRTAHLRDHVRAVADAVAQGVDVAGYHHRSLLDGWEFADGFTQHYGLVRVDHRTQERTRRASFAAYRDLIAGHRSRR